MSDGMLIDFNELRHDEEYHLGLGDIRLTIGMQGDIEKNFAFWIEETKKLQARIELKDNIIEMADENVKILKARISELELAIDWLGDDDLKDEVLKSGGNELVFIAMKIVDKLEIGDLQGLVSYAQNVYDIMKARERPRNTEIRRQISE